MNRKQSAKARSHAMREGNERGLYLLHTGHGKGKTSAAMNMVYRHLAHGMRVAVVQFVKMAGDFPDGDRKMLLKLQEMGFPVEVHTLGKGFTWNSTDEDANKAAAAAALEKARWLMKDPEVKLVLMDEAHIAIHHGQMSAEEVLDAVKERDPGTHVITTGRRAPDLLIDAADLVTEMKLIKHPISQKIPAQYGIEY